MALGPAGHLALEASNEANGPSTAAADFISPRRRDMKHKKNVTDAVRAANPANSRSSTGPRTKQGKSNSSHNALRRGVLARKVVLDTH